MRRTVPINHERKAPIMTDPSIPTTMKAVRIHPPAGIDGISCDEIATPEPGPGEYLVRVHAAALTRGELSWPADRLPAIPSYELSGTVVQGGPGASGFEPGQGVFAMTDFDRDGVAAEYAVVPAIELAPKPESLSHTEAAALPLPGLSAWQGLFDHGRLARNERVLIHGGAGGVGGQAVQLARLHGAYVIATASTGRVAVVRELGADEVVDHTVADFTAIDPVDLVFDTAGDYRLSRSVEVLDRGGRLVSVATEPPAEACAPRGIEAAWYLVESRFSQLAELARLIDDGALRVMVNRTFPLSDARQAFAALAARGGTGKVVLSVLEEER
jgi:NADPH:quinone reductase-like Zn-dependent oxidoreductase